MAECGPKPGCIYTNQMSYTIKDDEGNVVDKVIWKSNIKSELEGALLSKYATLAHIFDWREDELTPKIHSRVAKLLEQ